MKKADVQLAHLLDMTNPAAVFEEVKYNFIQYYPLSAFAPVRQTFNDFNDLFTGKYPGYRACNTKFHDKIHTSDALLAMSRLIDGYNLSHARLPLRDVQRGLIATILHDTGYIQMKKDRKGTGAKYTLNHVDRSIHFMDRYFAEKGFSRADFLAAARMVSCTGLAVDIAAIRFPTPAEKIVSKMLGAADLIGQMASRTYLERLVYLYREFKEGHVKGFQSEYELLDKTLGFYAATRLRLAKTLGNVDTYAAVHFRKRYGVKEDLYRKAMDRQIHYLEKCLKDKPESFRNHLHRTV